ncbi:MAG TPA: glycosyltransferase family 39 protein, partial [Pyrinomonadaceae bacterium]|nr:glycosyltransferase family 39 protein [Pyrinomonadaceae bacterium]
MILTFSDNFLQMTKRDAEVRTARPAILWLFAIAIVALYFFGLTIPLVGPDEPRYAQVAREMFERGDWITPTLGGFNWFEKPALLYWLQIASYHLFGVNEFASRFGSALFGLGTVASLWMLGRLAESDDSAATSTDQPSAIGFAHCLALVAATSIGLIVFSRAASFDIILTFPMTAGLVAFFIFDSKESTQTEDRYASLYLIAFYFFVGVSLVAKGLIGIVFPYAIVSSYYLLSRRLPSKRVILSLFWGTALASVVASAWYLPMYMKHGWLFIDEFIIQHHFQRYTSNKYFHPQPFYFFFWVLPLMTLPWMPFAFTGSWSFFRNSLADKTASVDKTKDGLHFRSALYFFSLSWLLVPLAFFSFSGSKLPGYILPALPPALVFAAFGVSRFATTRSRKRFVLGIAGLMIVGVVTTLIIAVPMFVKEDSTKYLIEKANERGFAGARVLSMHHISHNAEFYASGRLLRESDGRQKKFLGPTEILAEIRNEEGRTVLVIVPTEYLKQLTETSYLRSEVIDQ